MLWLVAAALAVAASFARVFSVRTTFHSEGLAGAFFGYAYDGWGRETVESSQQLDGGPVIAGPRHGVLFCACASLMLLACTMTLVPYRFRRFPSASTVGAVGCLILTGVTACQVIVSLPFRHVSAVTHDVFHFGLSPLLASMSCLAGGAAWALNGVATRDRSMRDRAADSEPPTTEAGAVRAIGRVTCRPR